MTDLASQKKQARLKSRVTKGGIKAARRQGITRSNSAKLKHVRVQVMGPVLRIVLGLVGIAMCAAPFLGWFSVYWALLLLPSGLICLIIAMTGRKKAVGDAIAEGGGELAEEVITGVIEGILDGL